MDNSLFQQLYRFAITGGGATLIHVCLALILHEYFLFGAPIANFIAFLVAWIFSYLGNFHWTFKEKGGHGQTLIPFLLLSLFGLMINQSIVIFADQYLRWGLRTSLVIVVISVPIFTFLVSKFFIFSKSKIVI